MAPSIMLHDLHMPASADFHCHLRDGTLMEAVARTIIPGGVDTVYVMPNLSPPITTVDQALAYRSRLITAEPRVNYLMTLYLHPSVTPETIREAAAAGIVGVKSYPAGVTTNSDAGVVDYEAYYPVFSEMERLGLVLNLHGESPSGKDITVLNAEEAFLPTLRLLHDRFPRLRIVLEHCTTEAAVNAVLACGDTVAGTITAHHLYLTVDDWANDPFCYCKPVAKTPKDRVALLRAAASGHPRLFFGSDSAPHDAKAKRGGPDGRAKTVAGVFTQPYATQLVVDAFSRGVAEGILDDATSPDRLVGFLSSSGRKFYGLASATLEKLHVTYAAQTLIEPLKVPHSDVMVLPFRTGEPTCKLTWK